MCILYSVCVCNCRYMCVCVYVLRCIHLINTIALVVLCNLPCLHLGNFSLPCHGRVELAVLWCGCPCLYRWARVDFIAGKPPLSLCLWVGEGGKGKGRERERERGELSICVP